MRHIDKTKTNQPNFLFQFRKQSEIHINYKNMRKAFKGTRILMCLLQ